MLIIATWIIPKPFISVLSPFYVPTMGSARWPMGGDIDACTILQNNTRNPASFIIFCACRGTATQWPVSKATLNLAEAESVMGATPPQASWVGPSL